MRQRFVAAAMAFVLLSSAMAVPAFAADRHITLEKACSYAKENSNGYQSTTIDLIKKRIELQQAKEAIRDTRKKESTVRFSLLFNIQFPEKHGMPKEIELLTKVPQIENEITTLEEKLEYELLHSQTNAEQAFYDVIAEQHKEAYIASRLKDLKSLKARMEKQVALGKAKKTDLEFVQTSITGFEKDKENNAAALENKKKKLGNLLGMDVQLGYTFQQEIPEISLKRNQLAEITQYALEHDFGLFEATEKRKLAEHETEVILSIYKNKYGGYIDQVENYIRSHEGKKIDYNNFISQYNTTLYQIDSPWYGNYVIKIIFFKIEIPKEWFKGEYSGTRYMEDEKYALFTALVDRDKARKEEEDAKKELMETIEDSYYSLKSIETSIREAEKNLQDMQGYYDTQLRDNKMGLLDFTSLEATRDTLYSQQESLFSLQIDYAKALSTFNMDTAGYINHLLGKGSVTQKEFAAGESLGEEATWYVKNTITDYNFIFGVEIPEKYGVDQYQLFYGERAVGAKTPITEQLVHSALAFEETAALKIKLYSGTQLKYEAMLEGDTYEGVLQLKEEKLSDQRGEGSWNLKNIDAFRQEFSMTAEAYDFDTYEVYNKEKLVGSAKNGEVLTALNLYFAPTDTVSVKLLKGNQEVTVLRLAEDAEGKMLVK